MNIAILLSGGTGSRVGGALPKQYIKVHGRPVISYAMEALLRAPQVDALWVVAEERWQEDIRQECHRLWENTEANAQKLMGFSMPGENRQLSIYNAMKDIGARFGEQIDEGTLVVIHDAARPKLTQELLEHLLAPFEEAGSMPERSMVDGVMPVLPMKDTVYLCEGNQVASLLNRSQVYAGQAPEAFRFLKYQRAIEQLLPDAIRSINGSTEPAIMSGMRVITIPGDEGNYKITTPADLERFGGEVK